MSIIQQDPTESKPEKILLGALITGQTDLLAELSEKDFPVSKDRLLYNTAVQIHGEGYEVNPTAVVQRLISQGKLESAGGAVYVARLTDNPGIHNSEFFLREMRKQARAREVTRLVQAAGEAIGRGENPGDVAEDLKNDIERIQGADDDPAGYRKLAVEYLFNFGKSSSVKIPFLDYFSLPGSGILTAGAKTGGGKTTFLNNLIRVYLEQGKKCCFITYELNAQEFALSLAISMYAADQCDPIPGWTPKDEGPGVRVYNLDNLKNALPPLDEEDNPEFSDTFGRIKQYIAETGEPPELLKKSYSKIAAAIDEGRLIIVEHPGNVNAVEKIINATDCDIYAVDYLQVIPPPDDVTSESYRRIAAVCDVFRRIGNAGRKLIVLGAQFNRQAGEETTAGAFDPRLEQFREAADIEQISTISIGIGYQTNEEGKREFFYKILKNRFAGRMAGAKMRSYGYFEYFLALRGGRWMHGENWTTPSPPRKLQGNQLKVKQIIEAGDIGRFEALQIFKDETGKQKSSFDAALNSLIARATIFENNGILSTNSQPKNTEHLPPKGGRVIRYGISGTDDTELQEFGSSVNRYSGEGVEAENSEIGLF